MVVGGGIKNRKNICRKSERKQQDHQTQKLNMSARILLGEKNHTSEGNRKLYLKSILSTKKVNGELEGIQKLKSHKVISISVADRE